ncbi:hypothetical protein [Sphingobium subterraneum]|uniref:Uncharacterized protein n=1 Tax=Sphingobium subterraneum TaxID=627688 RepID=A0A841J9H2_9SPHN|nr:hypothetical protein [Sphingobium subterraneum]MBB6124801.1 hypothetical protein [Sphingobium subterraneum]
MKPNVDLLTILGLSMAIHPLLTMWHEIGGHAVACAALGGHVATIGAYYVDCTGLAGWRSVVVSCAGVTVNAVLAVWAYALWTRATQDRARLVLWLIWVSEAFVAAGYFAFSGVSGFGDLGTGEGGGLEGLPMPVVIRVGELLFGIAAYILLVRAAIRSLNGMIGTGPQTDAVRKTIAHGFYAGAGAGAILVGLLNPVGLIITIMSAVASSFGGLAGFISVGYAIAPLDAPKPFSLARNRPVIIGGAAILIAFAAILGRSLYF